MAESPSRFLLNGTRGLKREGKRENSKSIKWTPCDVLTHDSLGDQHVIQPHELGVRRVVVLDVTEAENGALLNLAQDGEEGGLHAVAGQGVLTGLEKKEAKDY